MGICWYNDVKGDIRLFILEFIFNLKCKNFKIYVENIYVVILYYFEVSVNFMFKSIVMLFVVYFLIYEKNEVERKEEEM